MNIHKLKDKKKNINRELGRLYVKKRALLNSLKELEEAKLSNKIRLEILRSKKKKKNKKK